MSNLTKTTTDHLTIRKWAEERGGKPTHVKGTSDTYDVGLLRIDFPGYSGEGKLEPITWEDWFHKFDERGLALIYQEKTADGQRSNFNKIVSRETVEERKEASAATHKAAAGHSGQSSSHQTTSHQPASHETKETPPATSHQTTKSHQPAQQPSKTTGKKK